MFLQRSGRRMRACRIPESWRWDGSRLEPSTAHNIPGYRRHPPGPIRKQASVKVHRRIPMTVFARIVTTLLTSFIAVVISGSVAGGAQSLVEAAKAEAARRQGVKTPSKVYTNADAKRLDGWAPTKAEASKPKADMPPKLDHPTKPVRTGPSRTTAPRDTDCEDGHWVENVIADGEFVALEDGSLWQVGPLDRIDTQLWLATEDVLLCGTRLINTDTGDAVEVIRVR